MRAYVINLEASTDRRAHITAQLDAVGADYALYRGVDARHGYAHFAGYDEHRFLANTGRMASASEAACFASHRTLWKLCAERGEPLVVLEDDAAVLPYYPAALAAAAQLVGQCEFIRLQEHGPARHIRRKRVGRSGDFALDYFASYPFGAMGYAIAPTAAVRLLEASKMLSSPVDVFIRQFWVHGQPLFGLEPSCIRTSNYSWESTIDARVKQAMRARLRIARILAKLDAVIGRARFNLEFQRQLQGGKRSPLAGASGPRSTLRG
jgi:glycosyl transferase family 25